MTLTHLNASAATLTKNRTEDSVSPFSGMCTTCVDGCIGMCEIGKSAYRGAEMIYPQPFGIITTASQKDYPVDHTILGRATGRGAWRRIPIAGYLDTRGTKCLPCLKMRNRLRIPLSVAVGALVLAGLSSVAASG